MVKYWQKQVSENLMGITPPQLLAGMAGFEPTNARVKVWCLTAWRHPNVAAPSIGHASYYTTIFLHLSIAIFDFAPIPPIYPAKSQKKRRKPLLFPINTIGSAPEAAAHSARAAGVPAGRGHRKPVPSSQRATRSSCHHS